MEFGTPMNSTRLGLQPGPGATCRAGNSRLPAFSTLTGVAAVTVNLNRPAGNGRAFEEARSAMPADWSTTVLVLFSLAITQFPNVAPTFPGALRPQRLADEADFPATALTAARARSVAH